MARMLVQVPSIAGTTLLINKEEDGTDLAWVAAQAHKYLNNGIEILRIVKGVGASVLTVTSRAPNQYGLVLADRTINIPSGSDELYPAFSPEAHNERSGADKGYTSLAFSTVVGLVVYVIRPGDRVV